MIQISGVQSIDWQHGDLQTDVNLVTSCLEGNRKLTESHTEGAHVKKVLKVHPHSDTLIPTKP